MVNTTKKTQGEVQINDLKILTLASTVFGCNCKAYCISRLYIAASPLQHLSQVWNFWSTEVKTDVKYIWARDVSWLERLT